MYVFGGTQKSKIIEGFVSAMTVRFAAQNIAKRVWRGWLSNTAGLVLHKN
jgi:hypothetical protein